MAELHRLPAQLLSTLPRTRFTLPMMTLYGRDIIRANENGSGENINVDICDSGSDVVNVYYRQTSLGNACRRLRRC